MNISQRVKAVYRSMVEQTETPRRGEADVLDAVLPALAVADLLPQRCRFRGHVEATAKPAWEAFDTYRETDPEGRRPSWGIRGKGRAFLPVALPPVSALPRHTGEATPCHSLLISLGFALDNQSILRHKTYSRPL